MFKKIISIAALTVICSSALAYTNSDIETANYLADRGIVRDLSDSPDQYHLESYIDRVEVMGMLLTMTGTTKNDNCRGDYPEIDTSDKYGIWACIVAETAADKGYIHSQMDVSRNSRRIRPNDFVTRSEALGILMNAFPDDGAYAGYSYYWGSNFPTDGSTVGYKDYHNFPAMWQAAVFYNYIRQVTRDTTELNTDPRVNGLARIKEIFTFAREITENK